MMTSFHFFLTDTESTLSTEPSEMELEDQSVATTSSTSTDIENSDSKTTSKIEEVKKNNFYENWIKPRFNKGFMSNTFTFTVFIIGLIIISNSDEDTGINNFGTYILAFGLFGFAGGITNWIAVKMLFDKIPLLYGSGIIPKKFKEIRQKVKDTIMKTFFDEDYLSRYLRSKVDGLMSGINVHDQIRQALESPDLLALIDRKIEELNTKPEGMMFAMMGIEVSKLKPLITPFIISAATDFAPMLINKFDPLRLIKIERIRDELDSLMTEKLKELTAPVVKRLMEEVIRNHLGWLIVWGCVFGGSIGIISKIAGYGQ